MNISRNQKVIFSFLTALLVAFCTEFYVVAVESCLNPDYFSKLFSFKQFIIFTVLFFILFRIIYDDELRVKVFDFIYKYRYYISFLIIAICVLFQIHGSSINELNIFNVNHNPLLGISRPIRADEYDINTLLAFSPYPNHFGYFSDIIRAMSTDMFIVFWSGCF